MAFKSAVGYSNLPNGNWSPTIFSKTVQNQFRKKSVAKDITNGDYFGELSGFGDSVVIVKEPEIDIVDYARGTQVTPQDLADDAFNLVIDQAHMFSFAVDDIETKMSHVNWEEVASNRASYKMADEYDRHILAYASGYDYDKTTGLWSARTTPAGTKAESTADNDELLSYHKLNRLSFVSGASAADSVAVGVNGTYDITPLALLNRMKTLLDLQNVEQDGRWVVVDPVFLEILSDENSKFMDADYQDSEQLANGKLSSRKVRGFTLYTSNNLPRFGNGPGELDSTGSSTNYGVIIAGHRSAVAAAETLTKIEKIRADNTFADIVRGLHVFGRKVLRPQALIRCMYNKAN